eukprot:g17941.t1
MKKVKRGKWSFTAWKRVSQGKEAWRDSERRCSEVRKLQRKDEHLQKEVRTAGKEEEARQKDKKDHKEARKRILELMEHLDKPWSIKLKQADATAQDFCSWHACFVCLKEGARALEATDDPPRNACEKHALCWQCDELALPGRDACAEHDFIMCEAKVNGEPCRNRAASSLRPFCKDHMHLSQRRWGFSWGWSPAAPVLEESDGEERADVEENRKCIGQNRKGKPCQSKARPGSRYCDVHAPSEQTLEEMREAVSKDQVAVEPPPKQSFYAAEDIEDAEFASAGSEGSENPPNMDEDGKYDNQDEVEEADHLQHLREVYDFAEWSGESSSEDEAKEEENFQDQAEDAATKDTKQWTWDMSFQEPPAVSDSKAVPNVCFPKARVGPALPLCCGQHPTNSFGAEKATELKRGFCKAICEEQLMKLLLPCSHEPEMACAEEEEIQNGSRPMPRCDKTSHTPYVYPDCKHTREVTCYFLAEYKREPSKVPKCEHLVEYLPDCGQRTCAAQHNLFAHRSLILISHDVAILPRSHVPRSSRCEAGLEADVVMVWCEKEKPMAHWKLY